jgi:beta-glucosidase
MPESKWKDRTLPVEDRVACLLAEMTLPEKIRQTTVYPWVEVDWRPGMGPWMSTDGDFNAGRVAATLGDNAPGAVRGFENRGVTPGIAREGISGLENFRDAADLTNRLQQWLRDHTRLGIPALVLADAFHGHRGDWNVTHPEPIGLGATFDVGLLESIGKAIARAARADGMNCLRTPICDLARDARWGRCGECFGEDPWHVGELAAAMVRGMGGARLDYPESAASELRHYIHGAPELGCNATAAPVGERTLRRLYLPPFRAAIRAGAQSIMAAYNTIDELPCHADRRLLMDILRGELGFTGFVQSDATAITQLHCRYHVAGSTREAAALALESGVDMQNYDYANPEWETAVAEAIAQGALSMEALDRAVANILRVKFRLGLFENPFALEVTPIELERRREEDSGLALRAARESVVLLKNEQLLPLRKDIGCVAVVGPAGAPALFGTYCDPPIRGAWNVEDPGGEGLLAGLRRALPTTRILWEPGCAFAETGPSDKVQAITQFDHLARGTTGADTGEEGIRRAVEAARAADIVIVAVGDQLWLTTAEGKDNALAVLPGRQAELVTAVAATGKPVVLVVFADRALVLAHEVQVAGAALMAWQPGWRGGTALAEILTGQVSPGGRLPVTLPAHPCVLPLSLDSEALGRRYVDLQDKVLFPFGHGLSYTTFAYRDLCLSCATIGPADSVEAALTVENTGDRPGDEVVLCWVRQPIASVPVNGRMLRGMQRIHLAPGQHETVRFRLGAGELATVGVDLRERVELGRRLVDIGSLEAEFAVVADPFHAGE